MRKILVVDDEKRIRGIYKEFLTAEGFNVSEAENASQANEIIKHESIELMLLDIKMPEVEGDVLFEVVRCFHRQTKIIITSVYPLNEQRYLVQEADGYFDKSEGIRVLLDKIRKIL